MKKLPTDRVSQTLSSTLFKQIMKLCWQWMKVANTIIQWNDEVCPYSIWTVKIGNCNLRVIIYWSISRGSKPT